MKNLIKINRLFVALVLTASMFSCSNDDIDRECQPCNQNAPFDISGFEASDSTIVFIGNNPLSAEFSTSGDFLFASTGDSTFEYNRFPLSENWNLQTIGSADQTETNVNEYRVWNVVGDYNYRKETNSNFWRRYVSDVAFDIDEIVEEDEFFIGTSDDFIHVIPSGLKYYGIENNTIFEYTSIAPEQYSIDVAVNTETVNVNSILPNDGRILKGLKYSTDGMRVFIYKNGYTNPNEAVIYQLDLTIPFQINTALYNGTKVLFYVEAELLNVQFNETGNNFFIIDKSGTIKKFC